MVIPRSDPGPGPWVEAEIVAAYRVGGEDVQVRFVSLQQQAQHAEEALHQQVDALTVTGQQQLLHRLHRDAHIPEQQRREVTWRLSHVHAGVRVH